MLFPLLKAWLRPLFDCGTASSRTLKHPSGFRTIGGGDGTDSGATGRRRVALHSGLHGTSSKEQNVNIKMQNLENFTRAESMIDCPKNEILVSHEVYVVEDTTSQNSKRRCGSNILVGNTK